MRTKERPKLKVTTLQREPLLLKDVCLYVVAVVVVFFFKFRCWLFDVCSLNVSFGERLPSVEVQVSSNEVNMKGKV